MTFSVPQFAAALLVVAAAWLPSDARAQDWPVSAHDAQRTGYQPQPGAIERPAVAWSVSTGGRLGSEQYTLADVDLDGIEEVLIVAGGRVLAFRPGGSLLWASDLLGLDTIVAVTDFDDRLGRPQVFAGAFLGQLYALDGGSGDVLWRSDETTVPLGKILPLTMPDGMRGIYVADAGCSKAGAGTGRTYTFPTGFSAVPDPIVFDNSAHGYWCGVNDVLADVDGDGALDIVTQSNDRVIVYAPSTGLEVARTEVLARFPFGLAHVDAQDIDSDGRDELALATERPGSRRLSLVEYEAGELVLRWAREVDGTVGAHSFTPELFAQVSDTGRWHVVSSFYEPADGWSTILVSGSSSDGEPELRIAGKMLLGVTSPDGEGGPQTLLLRAAAAPDLPAHGDVESVALADGTPEVRWTSSASRLVFEATPWLARARLARQGTLPGTILFQDTVGDDRPDTLVRLLSDGTEAATHTTAGTVLVSLSSGGATLAMSTTDGRVTVLDDSLSIVNDEDGDGLADVQSANHLASARVATFTDAALLLYRDSGGVPTAYRTQTTGRVPLLAWQASSTAQTPPLFLPDDSGISRVAYHARGPDGRLSLTLLDALTGTPVSSHWLPGSGWSTASGRELLPLRGADGEISQLLSIAANLRSGVQRYDVVTLSTGMSRILDISTPSGHLGTASAFDYDGDGLEDVYMAAGTRVRVADPRTGATLATPPADASPAFVGNLSFFDMVGDGTVELLRAGGLLQVVKLTTTLGRVWGREADRIRDARIALAPTADGPAHIPLANIDNAAITLVSGVDGAVVAQFVLAGGNRYATDEEARADGAEPGRLSAFAAGADVTGLGHASFLVGSTDGHLYAFAADDGALDWSINLRARVGTPLSADIDGDGAADVLVPTSDGLLHGIVQASLSPPTAVFDTDGSFIAASPSEDLDVLGFSDAVGGNWAATPGADRYEYRVLRSDDVVVVPWTDVESTSFVEEGLSLQLGRRYYTAIRAFSDTGLASVEVVSDGFVVADTAPPEVDVLATPDLIILPSESTTIDVTLRDDVGLEQYRVEIRADDVLVRPLADTTTGGTLQRFVFAWDAEAGLATPGEYEVVAVVQDTAGHETTGSASITVCGPDGAGPDRCATPPPPPPDPPPPTPWQARGGCGCSVPSSTGTTPWPLAVLAFGMAFRRRR